MTQPVMETFHVRLPREDFESPLGNGESSVEDMTGWVERKFNGSYMTRTGAVTLFMWEVSIPSFQVGNAIERFQSFGFTVELGSDSVWQLVY